MSCYGGDDGRGDGVTSWVTTTDQSAPAFSFALHHLSFNMQRLRGAMLGMNGKLEKMQGVVELVSLGLRLHQKRVVRLEKKLKAVEGMVPSRSQRRGREAGESMKKGSPGSDGTAAPLESLNSERTLETSVPVVVPVCSRSSRSFGTTGSVSPDRRSKCHLSCHVSGSTTPSGATPTPSSTPTPSPRRRPTPSPGVASRAAFHTSKVDTAPTSRAALGRRLLKAVEDGSAQDVLELLDLGADPNFSASRRWVPLHRAARKADADVVSMLLLWGANVHARTSYDFTALHIAAYNDPSGRCVSALIDAASDVNGKNLSGRTPLHSATECGNQAAVRALLAAGARTTIRDDGGRTPYDVAKTDSVRRLLFPQRTFR